MDFKNKFDEYTLSKILSVGVLGLKKDKKLVPTRWSITATDDILAKNLLRKIRDFKWIENYEKDNTIKPDHMGIDISLNSCMSDSNSTCTR